MNTAFACLLLPSALAASELDRTGYGELLPSPSKAAALWWASSGWKVGRDRPPPERAGEAIRIRAARNEAEAAQLVIRPTKDLKGFAVRTGPLAGRDGASIPAAALEVLQVRYLEITVPTDATGAPGAWPDPLAPLRGPIDLPAEKNQPLWISMKVPRGAPAGLYRGEVSLDAEGYHERAPLAVEVYGFDLPDRMTCTSAFGFYPELIWRYHRLSDPARRREVLAKYLDLLAAHHISPYDPAPLDHFEVGWPSKEEVARGDRKPRIDWARWDAALEEAFGSRHFGTVHLPAPGMGGGTFHDREEPSLLGFGESTPEYKDLFAAYWGAVESHLKEKGWLDRAYVYWFDEPDPKDYAFVMNGFRKLREAAPGIPRMLTEQVEPGLVGGPTIWCPITNEYRHQPAEERRKAGEKFWWYVCTGPKAPYATLFIDHPATDLRVWLWQTWQRKIDGILVWATNWWTSDTAYPDPAQPQDPWSDPMSWMSGYGTPRGTRSPWGNGDGRFFYPPEGATSRQAGEVLEGPVASLRLSMLRDGIEDYEYLAILARLVRERGGRLEPAERVRIEKLLEVPAEITSDMTSFTRDPEPIERRRDEVARAIERLASR